ncbi:MAG: 50S ribosomal protein L21 [Microgenomates group bacterium Gr01-1014_7]|nr:MAG: 50S ribosomal protein L21 [Microgenomates group bacterium Gr01-1014_7]
MFDYAICEIAGKQYKVLPEKSMEVDCMGEEDNKIEVAVLLLVKDGKVQIGKSFLKDKIILKRLENKKGTKITVRKFHAKANFRKAIGFRRKLTKVIADVKN